MMKGVASLLRMNFRTWERAVVLPILDVDQPCLLETPWRVSTTTKSELSLVVIVQFLPPDQTTEPKTQERTP